MRDTSLAPISQSDMSILRRRLRSLLLAAAGGAVVGGAFGTAWSLLAVVLADSNDTITVTPQFPGAVFVVPLVWGALLGALSGGVFALLLMVAERGRGIAQLRPARVALWAAVSAAVTLRLGGGSWTLVALGSAIGAGIAAVGTALAKRGASSIKSESFTLDQTDKSLDLRDSTTVPLVQQHSRSQSQSHSQPES